MLASSWRPRLFITTAINFLLRLRKRTFLCIWNFFFPEESMTEKCKEARENEKIHPSVVVLTRTYWKLMDLTNLFVHVVQRNPVLFLGVWSPNMWMSGSYTKSDITISIYVPTVLWQVQWLAKQVVNVYILRGSVRADLCMTTSCAFLSGTTMWDMLKENTVQ